jgi:enoyl-[acyl-carrier protein] reductase I
MKFAPAIVVGVANEQSIAYAIAKELATYRTVYATYQTEKARKFIPNIDNVVFVKLDVTDEEDMQRFKCLLEELEGQFTAYHLVHSIAFAPLEALTDPLWKCSAKDFATTMDISVHSLLRLVKLIDPMNLYSVTALSYLGATRAVEGYDIMGVAKAALESTARYLTANHIRTNIVSPGVIKTRAAGGLPMFEDMYAKAYDLTPGLVATQTHAAMAVRMVIDNAAIGGQVIQVDGGRSVV